MDKPLKHTQLMWFGWKSSFNSSAAQGTLQREQHGKSVEKQIHRWSQKSSKY
ncbi:hypothetical protein [Flagellimonas meishanensis]|uniref:hypothetical protein n=1 Tax=Flagellimonas meishanensis TaxID=2873264 RepID=UPI001CA5FA76|nr:hypothetical protein [[Muricauda] meishanensis]